MPRLAETVRELAGLVGDGEVHTGQDVLARYRIDEALVEPQGAPLCVVLARSASDVVTAMRWAARHRIPIVPRGAGTGLAGGAGAGAGCAVLSLEAMTAIRELSVDDQLVRVEPGVITADLARTAAEHGLMYPVDPGSASRSTLGGNLATNAGGFRCCKYGATRDWVLGLDVVLAGGRRLQTGHRTAKGVSGYDLTGLFVGSEGTLGVIVEATLRLRPGREVPGVTVAAYFRSAVAATRPPLAFARAGLQPSLLELIDERSLRAATGSQDPGRAALLLAQFDDADAGRMADEAARLCRDEGAAEVEVTADPAEAGRLVEIRRRCLSALGGDGRTLVEDFVVPRRRLAEMLAAIDRIAGQHNVLVGTVVHAGDANLHPTFVFSRDEPQVPERVWAAAEEMFRTALGLGGTLTGEHGVGLLKKQWLRDELGDDSMDVHHAIKNALDPLGLMNPGKVL